MMTRNLQPRQTGYSVVDIAVAALDGNPNPLDMPMEGIDPSPTSLDMLEGERQEMCSRRMRPAEDTCIICGQPPCDGCVP